MKPGCLSEVELRELLSGNAAVDARVSAERHLDTCARCRADLESLAGSAEAFRSLHLHDGGQPQATPALDQVIRKLIDAPHAEPGEKTVQFDSREILHYLTASHDDKNLGRLGDYEVMEVVAAGGNGRRGKGTRRETEPRCRSQASGSSPRGGFKGTTAFSARGTRGGSDSS